MESGFPPSPAEPSQGTVNRINQFALVAYIDGKLGEFLLSLRQEIVPSCKLRSHVSILPPRPLIGSDKDAALFVQESGRHVPAFAVKLDEIEVFPVTNVIYIGIGAGLSDLHSTHSKMNAGGLLYAEPYPYHPHITLAQELSEAEHPGALQLCQARWKEYTGPRQFPVETLTFVQNTSNCGWIDLAEAHLEMAGSRL